ncbi:DNA alkylation repair protein [candidate division KSB1 bacterium]
MDYEKIIEKFESLYNKRNVEGMARYGITADKAYGISAPVLKSMAKEIGKNHVLAIKLWGSGIHDARALAIFIEDPGKVTETQMDKWVCDFDNWAVCDGTCLHLFRKMDFVYKKINEYVLSDKEFVKRAGFTLIAVMAVHDKEANDETFITYLNVIKAGASDERNYVKKAVNWALRQIGKRNMNLNKYAVKTAVDIKKIDSKAPKWIASDALRELKSEMVQKRLEEKSKRR